MDGLKTLRSRHWMLLGGTAMAIALAPAEAMAQPAEAAPAAQAPAPAASDNGDYGEIVVTAQKRVQNINDVGLTVAAISGDTFKQRQINTLADIAAAVPGLSFTQSGSNTPVYTLRGVGFYETTLGAYPDVSTYIDEAPLPFPVLTILTAFDLERVEVLKGPQGTLFGNNATGGAINYIVAKPTRSFEAGGQLGYGRFDTFSAEGYVSGPVSETLKLRIAGKAVHSGDWQHGYTFDGKTGKTETYAGRFLADWQATERLRIQINLNAWADKSDPQAVQYIQYRPNFPGAPSPVEFYPVYTGSSNRDADFSTNIDPHSDNKLYQAVGRIDFDVTDNVTATSLTSYVHYNQDMAYDGDGVTLNDFDVPMFDGKVRSFSQELRLASSGKSRFRWVVGANYERDVANDDYTLLYPDSTVFGGAGISNSGFRSNQKMKNWAGFANGELDFGKLTVKGGIRYTKADRKGSSCFYVFPGPSLPNFTALYQFLSDVLRTQAGLTPQTIAPQGCYTLDTTGIDGAAPTYLPGEFRGTLNEHNTAFKAGLDYKPSRNSLLYFNVTRGFKAGSFPSAAAATTAQLLGVTQESVTSYEGGFKVTAAQGKLQVNGAAFYYDYKNKQLRSKLLDPIFGVLDALVNIPQSRVQGAELEVTARPIEGLTTYANFVFIDSKIKKFTGYSGAGVFANFAGSPFPYAPKYQIAGGADYDFPVTDSLNAFLGGDVSYRSKTTAIIGNAPGYEIKSYTLVDVRAGVRSSDDRWRFQLWGKNITNAYYWTNVASYYDTVARYAGRPVTYGATLSFKFK
jgi:outer membrane receptor protein involved in Fe transport